MASSELLQIADAVAREESIPREAVVQALEEAIRVAARRKYGHENSIRAEIDRRTGETSLFREMLVVENLEDEIQEDIAEQYKYINKITLEAAKLKNADSEIGDILSEPLPAIDLGRVAAQSAKQVLTNKVKEIKRNKQFEEFKERIGEIMHGVVDKVEYGNLIVKVGGAEAIIHKNQLLHTDKFKQGDRVRALLMELNQEGSGPQIILSRAHNQFLVKLFAQEVPEIYDNIIQIKAVARDPGMRAKIAVYSSDSSIDAVGSCVGIRGARVQAVITELQGERIDVLPWSRDPATLVVHALSPAEVSKVIIDEEQSKIELVVPDEQLSIAIGKRGQNVKLASELVGWNLDVLTESEESKRRIEEFTNVTNLLMRALDVEEILAQLLASEGYNSVRNIAESEVSDLAAIEGLDEVICKELISRAQAYIEAKQAHEKEVAASKEADSSFVEEKHFDNAEHDSYVAENETFGGHELMSVKGMTAALSLRLQDSNILTIMDLADLSRDEFQEILGDIGVKDKEIDKLIMNAREKAYI